MGKIIKKRVEYGGSSNSAENIKYDDTKNVKEAINEVDSLLGNTDISAIGDGTVTGGLDALNSNLTELQSVDITPVSNNYAAVNTSGTYAYIKNGICYLQITINGTASYSGWANVAKLPIQLDTGGKELYFSAIDFSAQKAHSVVRIIGDGKVYCKPESGASLYANVSFPCKLTI